MSKSTLNRRRSSARSPARRWRRLLALGSLLGALAVVAPSAAAAAPLEPSQFGVRPLCGEPAPGHSGCLGLELAPHEPLSQPDTRAVARGRAFDRTRSVAGAGRSAAPGEAAEQKAPTVGSLSPANLLSAYDLSEATAPSQQTIALVDAYNDPRSGSRPESLRRTVRAARMHRRQRLLQAGQPARRKHEPAVPDDAAPAQARARRQRGRTRRSRSGGRLVGRDRDRRRGRARDLPELSDPARRGELERQRRPLRRGGDRGDARRDRDLELVGRRRVGPRLRPVQPSGSRDHRIGRRQRLSRLAQNENGQSARVSGQLAARGRRRRHAPEDQSA